MGGDEFLAWTAITDASGLAISLWMGLYLLARGNSNRLTFRTVIVLLALAFYYLNAFTAALTPGIDNRHLRSLAIIVAAVTSHNLTHYLLPPQLQIKNQWITRGVFAAGLITAVFLVSTPSQAGDSPYLLNPPDLGSTWVLGSLFQLLAATAILYNLVQIFRAGYRPLNRSFYAAIVFGISVIGYGLVGALTNLPLPRFVATLLLLTALNLLAYSITRHRVLIERRTAIYEFPVTALAIFSLAAFYVLVTSQMGLSTLQIVLIFILVITSHSVYDTLRESLNRVSRRQQRAMHLQLRRLTRDANTELPLAQGLQKGLGLLCANLDATGGLIGVRGEDGFQVLASEQALPLNARIPLEEARLESLVEATGGLGEHLEWLAPAFYAGEQVALVGVGPRLGLKAYSESDLNWLEDIADEVALMVRTYQEGQEVPPDPSDQSSATVKFLAALSLKPDPELIKSVEDCLRNLHDYIKLGKSPLAARLRVGGGTHIERGKAIHQILVRVIKSLRPPGERPGEPLPREWYNYVILHDAYVRDTPDREIMARLYISEGTFYRTRRKALRGVTRALIEANIRS